MKVTDIAIAGSAALIIACAATPTLAQDAATTETTAVETTEDEGGFDEWGLLGLLGLAGLLGLRRKDDNHRTTNTTTTGR